MKSFSYKIIKKTKNFKARAGIIKTPHGDIETPAFIVVGTKATVKALTPEQLKETGAQAILANAYHLYLQPGSKIINQSGGLSKFMNWGGPTFTDSGGFQVLSLGVGYKKTLTLETNVEIKNVIAAKNTRLAHVNDIGVSFKSHIDGSKHVFTPELSMQIQHDIGADIIFAFDECTSLMHSFDYQKKALQRTHEWALRCLKEHKKLSKKQNNQQALYGVVQGANYEELRNQAAKFMAELDFDGFGIGGAIEKNNLSGILTWVNDYLPEDKPRHLLGLSEPDDIIIGIKYGADTFDCVAPARVARNGALYSLDGRISIRKSIYANDFSKPVKECGCYTCNNYSAAYLNHLFRSGERLAATLATIHNEYFIVNLVNQIRQSIIDNTFEEFSRSWLKRYYK